MRYNIQKKYAKERDILSVRNKTPDDQVTFSRTKHSEPIWDEIIMLQKNKKIISKIIYIVKNVVKKINKCIYLLQ